MDGPNKCAMLLDTNISVNISSHRWPCDALFTTTTNYHSIFYLNLAKDLWPGID